MASFRSCGSVVIIGTGVVRKTVGGELCHRGRCGLCGVRDVYSLAASLPGEDWKARGEDIYGWPIYPLVLRSVFWSGSDAMMTSSS